VKKTIQGAFETTRQLLVFGIDGLMIPG